jgi:hypothetical protein
MLRSSGDGVESQVMTTTEIAKLALLISGLLSDLTVDESQRAMDELAKRLDALNTSADLWVYQARDAVVGVVREILDDRKRREMAIPRIAATECDAFDTPMGSVIAGLVWALACSHTSDEAVRRIAAGLIHCEPAEIRVTAEPVPVSMTIGVDVRRNAFIAAEPPRVLYTVTWSRGRSTCILRNAVQP